MSAPFHPAAAAREVGLSNCDLARRLLDSYKADGVQCQPGRALLALTVALDGVPRSPLVAS